MNNILWIAFEVIINFYQGGLETWFIYKFLTPKSQIKARNWAVFFSFTDGVLVTALNYVSVFEGISSVLYWINLFIFAVCFFENNLIKKFFSVAITQIIILFITSAELNIISSLFRITVADLVEKQNLIRFITLIIIQLSILICFIIATKILKYADEYTFSDWFAIIIMLVISVVLISMVHILSLTASSDERIYINLSYMVIMIMNYLTLYIIHSLFIKNQKLKEIEIIKLREQYLEQFIKNAESQYDSIRKIRHDIKDKYTTIYSLIKNKELNEAEDFILNNFDLINHSEAFIKTDSIIVNAIVNAKLTVASTLGIKISCITVSSFDGINELDLCDLLSNTLENAITACKDMPIDSNRFIYLEIGKENNIYSFLIKNSVHQSVMKNNPKLITTKNDKDKHGLGIAIIKDIACKYNGRYDYYAIDNTFCCSIILKTQLE